MDEQGRRVGYAVPAFCLLLMIVLLGGSYSSLSRCAASHRRRLGGDVRPMKMSIISGIRAADYRADDSGFATLTMLTKEYLDEIAKNTRPPPKGLSEPGADGHVFLTRCCWWWRASRPHSFQFFFTGALLSEVIFSDGLGLLGSKAAINRDYRSCSHALRLYAVGLVFKLISDLTYMLIDPARFWHPRRLSAPRG